MSAQRGGAGARSSAGRWPIGVIAAGERRDDQLRPAIEDQLGAGAAASVAAEVNSSRQAPVLLDEVLEAR
ncbi:hypothetical protein ACWDKQ_01985 [Saccharopolyspora sp. NPDC000995]